MVDFIDFARSEGRFGKHFDKDGNPSETLLRAKQDRLENWHLLQELAGVRGGKSPEAARPAAKAPPTSNGEQQTNGHPPLEFRIGTRVKYKSRSGWISGVVQSLEPAVLELDDETIIRTSLDVLQAGAAEGLIVTH